MKFLVDENIGKSIIEYLRACDHEVTWVKELKPGMSDRDIIKLALKEKRIIVTYDQDFGELVFFERQRHYGIILIRVSIDNVMHHLGALKRFLSLHTPTEIIGHFHKVGDEYL